MSACRVTIAGCAALAVAFLNGCSGGSTAPPVGKVTGTVLVDGSPVEGARVEFVPAAGGRPSTGLTDAQGRYELRWSADVMGAAVGQHTVSIRTERAGFSPEGDGEQAIEARQEMLPPEYNDESTLTEEVTAGANEINFMLETKGFKPTGPRRQVDP